MILGFMVALLSCHQSNSPDGFRDLDWGDRCDVKKPPFKGCDVEEGGAPGPVLYKCEDVPIYTYTADLSLLCVNDRFVCYEISVLEPGRISIYSDSRVKDFLSTVQEDWGPPKWESGSQFPTAKWNWEDGVEATLVVGVISEDDDDKPQVNGDAFVSQFTFTVVNRSLLDKMVEKYKVDAKEKYGL